MFSYDKWEENKRKELSDLSYDKLVESASRTAVFIEGQLTHGYYDSEDLFGQCGHIDNLYYLQEAIYKKSIEEDISNPRNFFDECWQLRSRGFDGPKRNQ